MNSIDKKNRSDKSESLEAFFQKVVMPLHENQPEGLHIFELEMNSGDSYYQKREQTSTLKSAFLYQVSDADSLKNALESVWANCSELKSIVGDVAQLAERLKDTDEKNEELSTLTYVMF